MPLDRTHWTDHKPGMPDSFEYAPWRGALDNKYPIYDGALPALGPATVTLVADWHIPETAPYRKPKKRFVAKAPAVIIRRIG